MLRVARTGALKAQTAATNSLRALVLTAPEHLHGQLSVLTRARLIATCRRLRPRAVHLDHPDEAAKASLRSVAERAHHLQLEARRLDAQIADLTARVAPATRAVFGLGPDTAAALITAIGDNPDRLRSESALVRASRRRRTDPGILGEDQPLSTLIAAGTGPQIARCTSPSSSACGTAGRRAPMPLADGLRGFRCQKRFAA
jgi:hypothetical protein